MKNSNKSFGTLCLTQQVFTHEHSGFNIKNSDRKCPYKQKSTFLTLSYLAPVKFVKLAAVVVYYMHCNKSVNYIIVSSRLGINLIFHLYQH